MVKEEKTKTEKMAPDELLNVIGLSPADNKESVNTALPY